MTLMLSGQGKVESGLKTPLKLSIWSSVLDAAMKKCSFLLNRYFRKIHPIWLQSKTQSYLSFPLANWQETAYWAYPKPGPPCRKHLSCPLLSQRLCTFSVLSDKEGPWVFFLVFVKIIKIQALRLFSFVLLKFSWWLAVVFDVAPGHCFWGVILSEDFEIFYRNPFSVATSLLATYNHKGDIMVLLVQQSCHWVLHFCYETMPGGCSSAVHLIDIISNRDFNGS